MSTGVRKWRPTRLERRAAEAWPIIVMSDVWQRCRRGLAPGWDGRSPDRYKVWAVYCYMAENRLRRKGRHRAYTSFYCNVGTRQIASALGMEQRTVWACQQVLRAMATASVVPLPIRRGQRSRYLLPWPRAGAVRSDVAGNVTSGRGGAVDNSASDVLGNVRVTFPRTSRVTREGIYPPTPRRRGGGARRDPPPAPGAPEPPGPAAPAERGAAGQGSAGQGTAPGRDAVSGMELSRAFAPFGDGLDVRGSVTGDVKRDRPKAIGDVLAGVLRALSPELRAEFERGVAEATKQKGKDQ